MQSDVKEITIDEAKKAAETLQQFASQKVNRDALSLIGRLHNKLLVEAHYDPDTEATQKFALQCMEIMDEFYKQIGHPKTNNTQTQSK